MVKLRPGDRINCRLKEGAIVAAYREYDEIRTFEIIAASEDDYYIFVPDYVFVKDTVRVDSYRRKKYDIDPRFLGEQMTFISESMVCQLVQRMDGMCCKLCQEFIPMGEPNQEDGETLICWACRQNPYY